MDLLRSAVSSTRGMPRVPLVAYNRAASGTGIRKTTREIFVEQEPIVDVTEANLRQVLEQSMQVPVIVDFHASWCEPCQQMAPILERVVREQQGRVLLARVDADAQQAIAAQFGVRSLPALKLVWQGQLVSELNGAQTEAGLREWLKPVLGEGEGGQEEREEAFLEQVEMAIEQGQGEQVEAAIRQALQQEPDLHRLRARLADYLLGQGRVEEARNLVAEVAEDVPELAHFRNRFALLEEFGDEPVNLDELAARLEGEASPEELYSFGLRAAAAGRFREGLDALLRLLRDHRDYRDGIAREALLRVFDCLPKGDALASEYRRKMFNLLY